MDCTDHSSSILDSKIAENFHDVCSGERIKTGCRLIKEDQARIGNELDTDGGTLTLTTRDTLDERSTNSSLRAFGELKVMDELVDTSDLLRKSSRKFKLSGKFKTFSYGHCLEKDIILLHIGGKRGEVPDFLLVLSIDQYLTSLHKVFRDLTAREEVKQSGLTGSGGTNDCQELTWLHSTRDSSDD